MQCPSSNLPRRLRLTVPSESLAYITTPPRTKKLDPTAEGGAIKIHVVLSGASSIQDTYQTTAYKKAGHSVVARNMDPRFLVGGQTKRSEVQGKPSITPIKPKYPLSYRTMLSRTAHPYGSSSYEDESEGHVSRWDVGRRIAVRTQEGDHIASTLDVVVSLSAVVYCGVGSTRVRSR
jgi:hypothetical protein